MFKQNISDFGTMVYGDRSMKLCQLVKS